MEGRRLPLALRAGAVRAFLGEVLDARAGAGTGAESVERGP
jgi:hypothetical protein